MNSYKPRAHRSGKTPGELATHGPDTLQRRAGGVGTACTKAQPSSVACTAGLPVYLKSRTGAQGNLSAVASLTQSRIAGLRGRGRPLNRAERSFYEPRFGADFGRVRLHEGAQAASAARSIGARAFTLGSDVVFGAGEYAPESDDSKRLLSHELTHTLQQGQGAMLRREPLEMDPITVRSGMPSDLSSLSTPAPAGSPTMSRDSATIERNSQLPGTVLPFAGSGWNGSEIANRLGQYDRIPGTDSDAVRCVQAVALMSHILNGPNATVGYLGSIALQGMLSARSIGTRERTALRVIEHVKDQIRDSQATYGDMYWAMEAVHDLFYGDDSGTPAETPDAVRSQIGPMLDMSQGLEEINVWCSTPADLMTQAASLNPGEQFLLNTWNVSFNHYFDIAGAAPTAPPRPANAPPPRLLRCR